MNAPHLNFKNIPEMWNPDFQSAVRAEEKRICSEIDDRLREVRDEFGVMLKEVSRQEELLANTKGFWERRKISKDLKRAEQRLIDVRRILDELLEARRNRTYA